MTASLSEPLTNDFALERPHTARRILVEAVVLGVVADGALRNAPGGLGWTLWVTALALAAWNVAQRHGHKVTREQLGWLGLGVACAVAFAWRDAEELRAANVLGTLVAFTLFAMSAAGSPARSILSARVRDVVAAGVYTLRDIIAGAPMLAVRDAALQTHPAVERGASWVALRAILLTVPLVLVFAVLLSQADPVFASVFALPNSERLFEHVVVIGAFSWWSAGWIRGALLGVARRPALPDRIPVRLGLAEVTTSLGAVIVLFTIFVALQVRWLFGGADVVLATTGLTVAEYARRGFFELVAVAILVAPLILVTRAVIEDAKVVRRHRLLSVVLIVLLVPNIASALLRMKLYVDHFGLTADRLYATALMAWLALVYVAMARTVLGGWARPFAAMTVLSGFVTLGALNVLNPDDLVARVNLGRSSAARPVDYNYLSRLNGDAVPAIVSTLIAAPPSGEACKTARTLRARWLEDHSVAWNLGAQLGREAVAAGLPETELLRLCAGAQAEGVPQEHSPGDA
jgi:hypothetical protein